MNSGATAERPRTGIRFQLPAILIVLLYVRLVWFVLRSVADIPFMDEWYLWSDLLQAIDDGSLSLGFLVSPYNGHRLAVMRLLLLALLPTRWTIYPQVLFTLAVTAVFMAVLWHYYRRTAVTLGRQADPWAAVALAALAFSCADINRLWGMGGLEFHVVVLASAVCLLLLSAEPFRWWRFVGAAISATVACFSAAPGLLAWILGLPVLWLAAASATVRVRALIGWTVSSAVACTLYLYDLPELGSSSMPSWTPARGIESARFVLMYVGLPIQIRYDHGWFLGVGIAAITLSIVYCALLWRKRPTVLRALLPWLALAVFSVGTAVMIAAVRFPLLLAVYYVTIARLFWIASIAVVCLMMARSSDEGSDSWRGWGRWRVPLVALALLSLEGLQTQVTLESWRPIRESLAQAVYDAPDVCAGNWNTISRLTHPPDAIRSRYPILAKHGIAFSRGVGLSGLELAGGSGAGAIEAAVVEASPPDGGSPCVRLSGWAVDPRSGEAAAEVLLVQGGKVIKRGAVNQASGETLGKQGLSRSRWDIFVSQQRWPRDSSLAVYAVGTDRKRAYRLDLADGVRFPFGDPGRHHEYSLGFVVDLTRPQDDLSYQLRGFSGPEAGGRWTDASEATILLTIGEPVRDGLKLVASVDAFLVPQHPTQRVEILVNDRPVGRWVFNLGDPMREREVAIPNSTAAAMNRLSITFRLPDAASPASLNLSPDTRLLGIRMGRFRVIGDR
jgi:hypothetical protein